MLDRAGERRTVRDRVHDIEPARLSSDADRLFDDRPCYWSNVISDLLPDSFDVGRSESIFQKLQSSSLLRVFTRHAQHETLEKASVQRFLLAGTQPATVIVSVEKTLELSGVLPAGEPHVVPQNLEDMIAASNIVDGLLFPRGPCDALLLNADESATSPIAKERSRVGDRIE